jgi:hypothetical protein
LINPTESGDSGGKTGGGGGTGGGEKPGGGGDSTGDGGGSAGGSGAGAAAFGSPDYFAYKDNKAEADFHTMLRQERCVVCTQNDPHSCKRRKKKIKTGYPKRMLATVSRLATSCLQSV